MEVSGAHQLFGYTYSSKYLLFCLAEDETTQPGLEQLEGESRV